MANVNQAKLVLFIFCILMVMQTSACESRRQAKLQSNQNTERLVASER